MVCPLLPQLDSDGTITIEEQIVLVMKAKVQCELNITAQLQEGGNHAKKCLFFVFFSPTSTKITRFLLTVREVLINHLLCFHVEGMWKEESSFVSLPHTPSLSYERKDWSD